MRRKTHAEFIEQVKHRPFDVLEQYKGNSLPILLKCHKCNTEWKSAPSHTLEGKGCPTCGNIKKGISGRKENAIIEDYRSWVLVDVSTRKYPGASMKIEIADMEIVRSLGGALMTKSGYVVINHKNRRNKKRLIHRVILNLDDGIAIDHKNGIRSDNRRSNLRQATHSQNSMNSVLRRDNTSGCRGVTLDNSHNKWQASITVQQKTIWLGRFVTKEEAISARKAAEKQYFGEFAYGESQYATATIGENQ